MRFTELFERLGGERATSVRNDALRRSKNLKNGQKFSKYMFSTMNVSFPLACFASVTGLAEQSLIRDRGCHYRQIFKSFFMQIWVHGLNFYPIFYWVG